ncbi:MFS transporter [Stenotrophomonas sp. CFBP8994]|uniref:MFS transporter n=1 Tax=Stenotrophomonas sp. CFBP8994 TaxID=3096527 RepID=UPI002A6ABDEA|nr:MFS transporter [Stenotrophomonas sp. CFBP8994]MDY0980005.1 MFS transporter [Stenotrophomonas sp. CFBP8994]
MTGGRNTKWVLLALLFFSTVINYLDRQALSILATTIQADLGMSDLEYARVVQVFLFAYAAAYVMAGRVTDWLGARVALLLFVGWWSLANIATGFVRSAFELGAARFALGLGEPGNYTVGTKVVSEQFPAPQRGLALGLYTAGAMIGATLAPPLIGGIALTYGWRSAFWITGVAGLLWMIAWYLVYPRPAQQAATAVTAAATAEAVATPALDTPAAPAPAASMKGVWGRLARDRTVWALVASRAVADPVWYFYLFWFPKYLGDARGMSLAAIASLAWIVYVAADIGSVGGGLISGRLVKRGMSPVRARLATMIGAACLAPVGMLVALHPPIPLLLALACVVTFAHLTYQINLTAMTVDLFPSRYIASVAGLVGCGSALGGMVSAQVVGHLVADGNFDRAFVLMAFLHPIAVLLAWTALRKAKRSRMTLVGPDAEAVAAA